MKKISVIIAAYNSGKTIQRTLESLKTQRFKDFEVIVVDGGSSDNTTRVIKENESIISRWISEPDQGVYDAWNKGLALSSGEWIYFLGSDDYIWREETFGAIYEAIKSLEGNNHRICYGKVALLHSDGTFWKIIGDPWNVAQRNFGIHMTIPHQGVFHHRSLFKEIGYFDDSFRIAGDYEWLLRAFRATSPLYFDIVVAAYSTDGISSNPNNIFKVIKEYVTARKKHGVYRFGLVDFKLWFKAILFYSMIKILPHSVASKIRFLWQRRGLSKKK